MSLIKLSLGDRKLQNYTFDIFVILHSEITNLLDHLIQNVSDFLTRREII